MTGEVQVFESSLENCDAFKFTYDRRQFDFGSLNQVDASLGFPGSLQETMSPWCYGNTSPLVDDITYGFINSTQVIYMCTNSTSVEDQDHRILFSWEYWLSSNESEVLGFMCEPRYSLTRRVVTNSTRNVGVQDNLNITGAITEILNIGIKPFNMTDKIVMRLGDEQARNVIGHEWNAWNTMLNITQPQNNLWSFRNTSLVIELSQRLWKGLAAYVVKNDYTFPSNETINGTAASSRGRLCVQELSLRLVEAHITLLLGLIMTLCFLRPGVFHRNPTSLGAHVMILARSPGLLNFLQGYGVASKQTIRTSLSDYLVSFPQNLPPQSPAIALSQFPDGSGDNFEKPLADNSNPREWWSPVSVRWWFRICLVTATLAVMIALEVLLQVSDRGKGLGDVSLDGYLKYTWSFLPNLVLVLVGLLFSMVDSTSRTLHPFQLMRKNGATMEDILHDPARQVSLMAVVYAAWKCQFVLLLATIPGLLAPILTIIASGLYTVAPIPWTYNAELVLEDWFRPEIRPLDDNGFFKGDTGEARGVFTLTQFSNMSYPEWTYEQYALAGFRTDNLHGHDGNDSALYITARVPAARVNFNCSMIGYYANGTYPTIPSTLDPQWLPVDPRPLGCHTTPEWNHTTGQRNLYLSINEFYGAGSKIWSWGYHFDLLQDDYEEYVCSHSYDCSGPHLHPVMTDSTRLCSDERQHYFFGFRYGDVGLSVLHCVPYVEALWVTAKFTLPDLSLVTDVPLVPERDSAVFVSDSASMTSFWRTDWQNFVVAIVNGSSGVGQLSGLSSDPANDNTRRLISAVESIFSRYFAQVLHLFYRQPVGEYSNASASSAGQNLLTPDGQPATGTVTDGTRLRLIQNTVSTRILQGLLAVMGACLVASTALGRGARVIPRDPGSVASRMAYFAGGEVWRRVPVGADRWTDEQIRKHGLGVSEGSLLLGWWGGDGREGSAEGARGKRFAVDVVGCKEAA